MHHESREVVREDPMEGSPEKALASIEGQLLVNGIEEGEESTHQLLVPFDVVGVNFLQVAFIDLGEMDVDVVEVVLELLEVEGHMTRA